MNAPWTGIHLGAVLYASGDFVRLGVLMCRRLFSLVSALLVGIAVCAACSQAPEKAVTVDATSASTSATGGSGAARGAGAELTQAQAEAALLTVAELPTGFTAQPSSASPTTTLDAQIAPPACRDLFDAFKSQDSQPASAKANASFSQGGLMGVLLSQSIASYSKADTGDTVKSVGQMLSTCPSFTATTGSTTTAFTASALSFPNLGDQTFAGRLTGVTQGITATLDIVIVGVGHNMLSFVAGGLQPMNPADLEKVARDGVTKLATVTG